MLAQHGVFHARRDELLGHLTQADDRAVVTAARDWHRLAQDLQARPRHYVGLLERWSGSMLARPGGA